MYEQVVAIWQQADRGPVEGRLAVHVMTSIETVYPWTALHVVPIKGFTESLRSFLRDRDEPAWLTERRREAFARFQAFAWPSARDEEWRRTDIRGLRLDAFGPPASEEPSAAGPGRSRRPAGGR